MSMLETISVVSSLVTREVASLPSEAQRDVITALDDGLDIILGTLIGAKYGVQVVCNPNGDRGLISIDGVEMNHSEFNDWLIARESIPSQEETPRQGNRLRFEESTLPDEVSISKDEVEDESDIKGYLRRTYACCLARGCELDIEETDDTYEVSNIQWGRKLSASERVELGL